MWINWTHENRLRKESPDRNIALAVLRRNIIILQCSSATSSATVQLAARLVTAGLWPFLRPFRRPEAPADPPRRVLFCPAIIELGIRRKDKG